MSGRWSIIGGFYVLTLFLGFGAAQARRARQHRGGRRRRQYGRHRFSPNTSAAVRTRCSATSCWLSSRRSLSLPSSRWWPGWCWHRHPRWRTTCTSVCSGTAKRSRRTGQVNAARVATVIVGAIAIGDWHRCERPECGGAGGACVRGRRERQFSLRPADAALEALQYRRHRRGHAGWHDGGRRPHAGIAEPHLSEGRQSRRAQSARRRSRPNAPTATEALQSDDAKQVAKAKKDLAALDKAVAKAKDDIAKWGDTRPRSWDWKRR